MAKTQGTTSRPTPLPTVARPPEALRAIWPNLHGVQALLMPECRLESLLDARHPGAFPAPNWIYVDCVPALPILKATGHYLDNIEVVWTRALLDEQVVSVAGASLAELTAFLATQGFQQIEVRANGQGCVSLGRNNLFRLRGSCSSFKEQDYLSC